MVSEGTGIGWIQGRVSDGAWWPEGSGQVQRRYSARKRGQGGSTRGHGQGRVSGGQGQGGGREGVQG